MATSAAADPLGIRLTPYIPHVPTPKQHAFLWLNCLEALYGGAAGGGKSDALLMAAAQYVDVEDYSALLIRRTFPDLNQPGALIPRSKEWWSGAARWNANEHRWYFPSGATMTFGHVQHDDDVYQYQGAEFDFIGIDEVTQLTEFVYRYLFSRIRRISGSGVPPRMRGASNPGGRGHRWVKDRFIKKLPDEPDDPESVQAARERIFIPAGLGDNPHLDQHEYRRSLAVLDPQTRAQLLDGDWDAREPGDWVFPAYLEDIFKLGREYDQLWTKGRMPPPVGGSLILAADWGVHSHLLLLWPLEMGGFWAVHEFVYEHDGDSNVRQIAPKVADAIKSLGYAVRQERFDASQPVVNAAFLERLKELIGPVKWTAVPFNKFKAPTIDYLRMLAHNTGETKHPPFLAVSPDGCPVLADQMRQWRYKDPHTGLIEKEDDHGPDALVAGAAPEAARANKRKGP